MERPQLKSLSLFPFRRAAPPPRHFERSRPTFFFRIRSCECVGLRREKSLCSLLSAPHPTADQRTASHPKSCNRPIHFGDRFMSTSSFMPEAASLRGPLRAQHQQLRSTKRAHKTERPPRHPRSRTPRAHHRATQRPHSRSERTAAPRDRTGERHASRQRQTRTPGKPRPTPPHHAPRHASNADRPPDEVTVRF